MLRTAAVLLTRSRHAAEPSNVGVACREKRLHLKPGVALSPPGARLRASVLACRRRRDCASTRTGTGTSTSTSTGTGTSTELLLVAGVEAPQCARHLAGLPRWLDPRALPHALPGALRRVLRLRRAA